MKNKTKISALKLLLFICMGYTVLFFCTYELSWLLYLAKCRELIRIEASVENISANRYRRYTVYQTNVKYCYNEEVYEEEILSDMRDWKRDSVDIYIEEDYPRRIYRNKFIWIPLSPGSIGAVLALGLSLLFFCIICKLKKEEIPDYKIPNE